MQLEPSYDVDYLSILLYMSSLTSASGFGRPESVSWKVKFPKYVCLVAQLGKEFLEKQILKIVISIVVSIFINIIQHEQ